MNEPRKNRLRVWTPLLFSFIMIFGMVLGFNLRDTLRNKRDIQTIIERNDRLEQIIDLINEKYVDSVNSNLLYEDAITGILSHLDPHTVYIPPDRLEIVNEDLEGSFFGIGVEFSIIKDTIQVTSVIEDGPAQHAGVDIGDKLIMVGDSVVAGTGITSERIIKMLRGKQHTRVLVTLQSPFRKIPKKVIIERDAIPLYSIEATLMLRPHIGYIRINRFSATTEKEFTKALNDLKKKGATALILDLRQNPGGYLDAATSIADEVLDDEKLIVYTQGRHAPRTDYRAGKEGMFELGRLAILVDESSASASEVLAGAVQDWDRGVIIGRRTYGKGLVQEQYDMENGAALRLTVARYYTPSGRSIQRSYAKGKAAYADDLDRRFRSGELTGTDTLPPAPPDTTRYFTHNKRPVFGGGGITPDIFVPYDTAKINASLLDMLFSEATKAFLWNYFIQHRNELRQFKTPEDFQRNFDVQELLNSYSATVPAKMLPSFNKVLKRPVSKEYLVNQMKAQLARFLFRNNGYYFVESSTDDAIQQALKVITSNQYLKIIGR